MVPVPEEWLKEQREIRLGQAGQDLKEFLETRHWSEKDFELSLAFPEAMRLFAEATWGPSLEESFLAANGAHDEVVYSMLRVEDTCLARELWIRLEEGEATFAEVAGTFGEGPEALRKGLIGPTQMGKVFPTQLAARLRSLQNGELHPPLRLSDGSKEWNVLIRLENLTPARFDDSMRSDLLKKLLDKFFTERSIQMMRGERLEEITYEQD